MLSSVTKQQKFCSPPFLPFSPGSAPATFWWTSNELNNSKGVANFKFQVLLSLWHESELTLTLPCLPPSPSPPPLLPPLECTVWGTIHAWLWFACPSLLPYQRCVIRSPHGSKVAQLIYLYPRDTCYNDNNNCLRSSFAYSITCSCCCSPTRSVVVVVSVACVVIFPTTHCVRIYTRDECIYNTYTKYVCCYLYCYN